MAYRNDLAPARLRELFAYDATTGLLTRLTSQGRSSAGSVVRGRANKLGRLWIAVDKRNVGLPRAVWALVHGVWPSGDIDHVNGDFTDNRIANLRDVPHGVNMQNMRKAPSSNRTGVLGAQRRGNRFRAAIRIKGRQTVLGWFGTAEQAHAAYVAAKRVHHVGCTI